MSGQWIEIEDSDGGICRRVSPGERIELQVYPVLFGFRVRAGWVGTGHVGIDWCCGDRHDVLQAHYRIALALLDAAIEEINPFECIPSVSLVKPVTRDAEFTKTILRLLDPIPRRMLTDEFLTLPSIDELKTRWRRSVGAVLIPIPGSIMNVADEHDK